MGGGFYYHTSYNKNRGFTCGTKPDPRVQAACPCVTPNVEWVKYKKTNNPNCNTICGRKHMTCNNEALKTTTLQRNCATLKSAFGGGVCRLCGPSDSTNTYCFPGKVAGGFYYHTSYNKNRGFTCATKPDPRVQSVCPCNTKTKWYAASGTSNPNCATQCRNRGKKCDSAAIKSATLERNCATLKTIFGGGVCRLCGPSDSTNTYCFPGKVAGGFYYHTSYNKNRGFTCNTKPDPRVRSACPCS